MWRRGRGCVYLHLIKCVVVCLWSASWQKGWNCANVLSAVTNGCFSTAVYWHAVIFYAWLKAWESLKCKAFASLVACCTSCCDDNRKHHIRQSNALLQQSPWLSALQVCSTQSLWAAEGIYSRAASDAAIHDGVCWWHRGLASPCQGWVEEAYPWQLHWQRCAASQERSEVLIGHAGCIGPPDLLFCYLIRWITCVWCVQITFCGAPSSHMIIL